MSRYRVEVCIDVDVDADSPEEAAAAARVRFNLLLPGVELTVSKDDGSQWQEVGQFLPHEVRR